MNAFLKSGTLTRIDWSKYSFSPPEELDEEESEEYDEDYFMKLKEKDE